MLPKLTRQGALTSGAAGEDGAGILLEIPHALYARDVPGLPAPGEYAVGMLFLDPRRAPDQRATIERLVVLQGLRVLGWRIPPVDATQCGPVATASRPLVAQLFMAGELSRLRRARARVERDDRVYVCSWSTQTVVYKGLLAPERLAAFYLDLTDPRCVSAAALVHQWFASGAAPIWERSHPYRLARTRRPYLEVDASDSEMLDVSLELLLAREAPPAPAELWPEEHAFHAWHAAALVAPGDSAGALRWARGRCRPRRRISGPRRADRSPARAAG